MKAISIITTILMLGFFLVSCSKKELNIPLPFPEVMTPEMMVERGKYIVNTAACDDCHTPKIMTANGPEFDMTRRLSGHRSELQVAEITDKTLIKDFGLFNHELTAWVGPWGTSFSANLTPDDTGTGNWTVDQFKTAIKKGKYKGMEGSRTLLPPMPWQVYKNFTDQDLECIFAYLQSLPPIKNLVPAPIPPVQS
jgi:Cytochrome c